METIRYFAIGYVVNGMFGISEVGIHPIKCKGFPIARKVEESIMAKKLEQNRFGVVNLTSIYEFSTERDQEQFFSEKQFDGTISTL